jgi:hypothetical protein
MPLDHAIQHAPRLKTSHHAAEQVHGTGAAGRFNAWLAVKITGAVGSMWCAYVFAVIALVGLPSAIQQSQTQGPLPVVQWIAQTFLQLVLLSVIMVGQNVIQAASDLRAVADHETLLALKAINVTQLEILQRLANLEANESRS